MVDTKVAPYAPPATVLGIIRHYRSRDVPERVTPTNLMQIGVTESLMSRTVAALRFLNLIREDMTTTDQFRALRYANDEDYQSVLNGILNESYKEVLDHLDVTTATEREINNAFIPYSPGGQRGRMITMFLALAREAGWEVAVSSKAPAARQKSDRRTPKPRIERKSEDLPPLSRTTDRPGSSVLLFGVTDADVAALDDAEFAEVWAALGKVARARSRHSTKERPQHDGQ